MAKKHDVCADDEVVVGALKPVQVGRSTVVLSRLPSGEIRAFSGRCPHHGAPLQFGCLTGRTHGERAGDMNFDRAGEIMRCPWHGFEFDLVTGDPAVPPPNGEAMALRFYTVEVDAGRVWVSP